MLFYTTWTNNKCSWPFIFPTFHFFWELNQSTLKHLECLIYGCFLKGRCIIKSGHLFYISLQRNAVLSRLVARTNVCHIEREHVPTSNLCSFITLSPALLRDNTGLTDSMCKPGCSSQYKDSLLWSVVLSFLVILK